MYVLFDGSAASAIDMLWQLFLGSFSETASAIDMLWRSFLLEYHLVLLLPGCRVFLSSHWVLILLLLPLVWLKSIVVILSVCFLGCSFAFL